MLNKKGKVITELLVMGILVVVISAVILGLIQSGVLMVRAEGPDVDVLNTEFIPLARTGSLVVKDFGFCRFVDADYNCVNKLKKFPLGSDVHFSFVVESSESEGEVVIIQNYKVKGPDGRLLLDVNDEQNFIGAGELKFKEYFVTSPALAEGEYSIELIVENPLIGKKARIIKTVELYK
jgi:hypothetical protein